MIRFIFFDLGDTLIYREQEHRTLDIMLIETLFKETKDEINTAFEIGEAQFPEAYNMNTLLPPFRNLKMEEDFWKKFFKFIFSYLEIPSHHLRSFLKTRERQERYYLFPGVLKTLAYLKNKNFVLGIASDGRPSRRKVLHQLKIDKFFDPKLIIISSEIGFPKTNLQFFQILLNRIKQEGQTCLLCDDQESALTTARKVGITTFLIKHRGRKSPFNALIEFLTKCTP